MIVNIAQWALNQCPKEINAKCRKSGVHSDNSFSERCRLFKVMDCHCFLRADGWRGQVGAMALWMQIEGSQLLDAEM